jgi:hypothetical protein
MSADATYRMLAIVFILDRPATEHQAKRATRWISRIRAVAAVLFVVAAANHARLAAAREGVVWRHELFVGINIAAAAGLLARPRWTLAPLAALACQQIPSHGADFVSSLGTEEVDWPSLGVVVFFPAVLMLLVVERRRGTRGPPSRALRGS